MKKLEQKKAGHPPATKRILYSLKIPKIDLLTQALRIKKKSVMYFFLNATSKLSRETKKMINEENNVSPLSGGEKQTKIDLYCAIFATLSQAPFEKEVKI